VVTAKPVQEAKRFVYVRVSTEQQLEGREYHSNASQQDFLIEWVARKGGEVFRVYEDTESGTKFEERPGLMALVRDALANRFDEAVAYNADAGAGRSIH
jgi:DNA invertase Pin-like site-specific DNA recombinase